MRTTFALRCTNRDGLEAVFDVTCDTTDSDGSQPTSWAFRVRPQNVTSVEFFELTLEERADGFARIVMMNNHRDPALVGAGIPDALLPEAARRTGRCIQSSPSAGEARDVYRTTDATKVWERLVRKGLATFDKPADIYTLLKTP